MLPVSDAINQIAERAPKQPLEALEYYEDVRNWLDAKISLLRAHLATTTERPHETIARIARETRTSQESTALYETERQAKALRDYLDSGQEAVK